MAHLPSELERYMQDSMGELVGLRSVREESLLRDKLKQAELSQLELKHQVVYLGELLTKMRDRFSKAREESVLNAQAIKRQVLETQKMAECYRQATEECSRLENECVLFQNDRQVFMEAADEAEERAAEAERQAEKVLEEAEMQHRDQVLIHDMVVSSVNAGAWRAVEQERDIALYRLKSSERCVQDLLAEVQELRKDAQQYEANLKKAEVEVEYLYQENIELKLLLGGKQPVAISPLHIQGIKCSSASKSHNGSLLGLSPRQPLTPLRCNDWRRQYR